MTLNEMVKNFEINCKKVERIVVNEKFEVKYIMKGEKEKAQ